MMYHRPEVRIVQNQHTEDIPMEVTNSEMESLLAKYGFRPNNPQYTQEINNQPTFEELVQMEDRRLLEERRRRIGPKAATFDNNNVKYSNSEWRDLGIDGQNVGITVHIVSDMPIN